MKRLLKLTVLVALLTAEAAIIYYAFFHVGLRA
jgi:hypothetical protein